MSLPPPLKNGWSHCASAGLYLCVVASVLFAGWSCGSADLSSIAGPQTEPEFREPRRLLAQHKVDQARSAYRDLLVDREPDAPGFGKAAAGLAVTETLLVLERRPIDNLLVEHLGAESPLEVNRALYADNGYFYWWSRGTPWVGNGDRPGIRDLIASRLPWSADELVSLAAFTKGLNEPTGEWRDHLANLASSLADIESYVDRALEDEDFEAIFIPGEVFHDDDRSMTLRRSELAALGAVLAGTRAICHALRSYEHPWSLEEAFGPQWEQKASDNPPENEGWTAWDYSVDFLATRLAAIKTGPDPREMSRSALKDALSWAERSIDLGLEESGKTSRLSWSSVDPEYARSLGDLLGALRQSLDQRTTLPTSSPETSANFASFFIEGRSLPDRARWWKANPVRSDSSDPDSKVLYIEWLWVDSTLQKTLIDGFYEPPIDITSDTYEQRIGAFENLTTFWNNLTTRQYPTN